MISAGSPSISGAVIRKVLVIVYIQFISPLVLIVHCQLLQSYAPCLMPSFLACCCNCFASLQFPQLFSCLCLSAVLGSCSPLYMITIDIDFSFCWLNLEVSWFLWNRTSGWSLRQAFIHYCRLLQVWKGTRIHALICSLKCLLSMLRCMLGSVKCEKSENPKKKEEIGNEKRGGIKN